MAVTNNEQMVDFPDLLLDTGAGATAIRSVFRKAAIDTAAGLQVVSIDIGNSTAGGGSSTVYLRIFDSLDPLVGTTDPEVIIMAPHGGSTSVVITTGIPITNNVSYAVVKEAGTAGTTAPSTTVTLTLVGSR
tara:strand:- start:11567 stop:11962 length:396 start_codon:yes stop_codon:yes gene_type:complete